MSFLPRARSSFQPVAFTFLLALAGSLYASPLAHKPSALRCDSLVEPLGIDDATPLFAWKLNDPTEGARQTAYELTIFSKLPGLPATRADVWDSGRVTASTSIGVPYGGPSLRPEHRYFWRVQVWDQNGRAYPASELTWWETGLMKQRWQAQWIGYEDKEQHSLRESGAVWLTSLASTPSSSHDTHTAFRFPFSLDKPVQRAVLYTTGQDTAAAWVNGKQVLRAQPLSPWQHMPWGTYARQDVTSSMQAGNNLLAVEIIRYILPAEKSVPTKTPMSTCLYVAFADGSTRLFSTANPGWTSTQNAPANWWQPAFRDDKWSPGTLYISQKPGSGEPGLPWPTGPVAALRHNFRQDKPVTSARLYATALGAYAFRINGSAVGDQVLAPGWMDYREHVAYQVYDVTRQIKQGNNAIAAWLAPGWYSTPLMWLRQGNNYGATQPALKAQLRLEHADGSIDWIATDATWRADLSPILQAEIYDGETMDARRQTPGWDTGTFSDISWHSATVVAPHEPEIVAQSFPPIREEQVVSVKAITEPHPGIYVFDFGQNMGAVPRLRVHGARGDDIKLRVAEVLNADGTLYVDNLRSAKATDHYIVAGRAAVEQYQPLFTFHGFRYAEITGLRARPTSDTLKAVVLHTDAPFTTRLSTGNPMVNQLWSNILWGQRSNFVGAPTDCPQRDERLGWSADAQVFWRTATYNMDLSAFSQKYAADLLGTQVGTAMYGIFAPGVTSSNPGFGAAWSDAGIIIPWTAWVQSGDTRILDQNWSGMRAYLSAIQEQNPDYLWRKSFGTPFGDWLTPTLTTPEDLLATAYWAYDVTRMQQMATATGRSGEAARYAALFEKIKGAFQKAYIRQDGFVGTVDRYPSLPPPTLHPEAGSKDQNQLVETQTGYVLALYMSLVPADLRAAAADRLIQKIKDNDWLLGTGFLGTPYLLEVLSDTGHSDVAYQLLLNRQYPSWGYLIDHGATTTWERWNGDRMLGDPSMNSYNHYAYGAVAEWLYRYAAGVDTIAASPGFQTIYLHPNFDARLAHLSFDYDSSYGPVHSEWAVAGNRVRWKVTVPPNATALLSPAATNASSFLLDGAPLAHSARARANGAGQYSLTSGRYSLTATLSSAHPETLTSLVKATSK